jgi:hypothetical protein
VFNCSNCERPVGPRVSPIMFPSAQRSRVYYGKNEAGEQTVVGFGSEIVSELHLCYRCAGTNPPVETVPDFRYIVAQAEGAHEHVRSCKRPLEATVDAKTGKVKEGCAVCKFNMAWFASLTPQQLSHALQEPMAARRPQRPAVVESLKQFGRDTFAKK